MALKIVKLLFFLYQGVTRSNIAACRFKPTCSKYLVDAVEKYGFLEGTQKAVARLAACHPFSKRPIIDPA
jgi:putative membrane protein insertion efficiency factor